METEEKQLYADQPVNVEFHGGKMWVTLADGRTIGTPLTWYPRLLMATPEQREHVELGPFGLHWPEIDEDLSIDGMLNGRRPRQPLTEYLEQMTADGIPATAFD